MRGGRKKPVEDHTGREWPSFPEMCAAYGQRPSTVRNRVGRGWTLEQALTVTNEGTHPKIRHQKPIQDHLGNWYGCVREMAEAYGINEKVYWSRKRICRWPLEKILTTPVNDLPPNAVTVRDHEGNSFPSVSHMCRHWRVGLSTYRERVKRGWDTEQALTGAKRMPGVPDAEACRDHLGNEYPSKAAMAGAYGKTRHCVQSRLDMGWSLERALTEPFVVNAKPCADGAGHTFPTAKSMAAYYGFPHYAFQAVKDPAAKIPEYAAKYWPGRSAGDWKVHACVCFPWFRVSTPEGQAIAHFGKILEKWHQDPAFEPLPATKVPNRRLTVTKCLGFPWFLAQFDGQPAVLNYWRLIELDAETNFGLSKPVDTQDGGEHA